MKNLLEFVSKGRSNDFVENVNKTLAKKLFLAISEQASVVAREAYGTLEEYFGGDEQPDYVNREDNSYAVFFANALKKFGVNGPEDFRDDVTKQRFFDYVDHNWRAQDSVQTPLQGANGGNVEQGTQTQLPAPAAPPQAPTAPTQGPTPTTAQGNDPSLATMAPAGPSMNQTAPMSQAGSDPALNGAQNAQQGMGGMPDPAQQACPYCKGSGKAACPTCGRPHGLDNQQGGMGGDQDPNLEIGPEGDDSEVQGELGNQLGGPSDDEGDDTEMSAGAEDLEGGEQDPNGENIDGGMGDDGMGMEGGDEMGQDPNADPNAMGGDDEQQVPGAPGQEEDVDDPFDDEDAYTIDASDFDGAGGGGDEMGGGEEEAEVDEDGNPIDNGMGGDEEDDALDAEGGGEEEGGFPQQAGGDEEGDEEDPDLEVGDEDTADEEGDDEDQGGFPPKKKAGGDESDEEDEGQDEAGDEEEDAPVMGEALKHRSWSRKERKADSKKPVRAAGKKEARLAEDFGFGLDDAEDDVWLTEALMMQQQAAPVDPGLNKIIGYVQQQLSKIKKLRNTMLMQLRRQRAVIKKDPALGPEEKMEAMKQLATMAKDNRSFFKQQAKLTKAMFTGQLSGGGMEGDEDEDMQGQEGMDDGQEMSPDGQDQGFPPQSGDEEGAEDMGGDEEGMEDTGDDEGQGGFPPKKKSPFPPKKKAGGFPPAAADDDEGGDEENVDTDDGGDEEAAPAPVAKKKSFPPMKESESQLKMRMLKSRR